MTADTLAVQSLRKELGDAEYERLLRVWFRYWTISPNTPLKRSNRTPAMRACIQEMARRQCLEMAREERAA